MHTRLYAFWVVTAVLASSMLAGEVRTRDGKTFYGDIALAEDGKVIVTGAKGAPVTLALRDIEQARFGGAAYAPASRPATRPAAWVARDIGEGGGRGRSSINGGKILIQDQARGLVEKRTSDGLYFIFQPLAGDGHILARVMYVSGSSAARAGLMIREGLGADAPYVAILRCADVSVLQVRAQKGAETQAPARAQRPVMGAAWLKLVRAGNSFSAFESTDGKRWNLVGEAVVQFPADAALYIGVVAANGAAAGQPAQSLFEQVTLGAGEASRDEQPRGVKTLGGSFIAGQVGGISDKAVSVQRGANSLDVPVDQVSSVIFKSMTGTAAAKMREGRPGVLLENGDFMDGEFHGIAEGKVRISSVVFGLRGFDLARQVTGLVLRPAVGDRAVYEVRLLDASVLRGERIGTSAREIVCHDAGGPSIAAAVSEVAEIRRIGAPATRP